MAVKLQLRKSLLARFLLSKVGKAFVVCSLLALTIGVGVFTYYYVKYGRMTEEKLRAGPFANTSLLYAAPQPVSVGEEDDRLTKSPPICAAAATPNRATTASAGITSVPTPSKSIPAPTRTTPKAPSIKVAARAHRRRSSRCAIKPSAPSIMLEPELITNLFDRYAREAAHRALQRYSAGDGQRAACRRG